MIDSTMILVGLLLYPCGDNQAPRASSETSNVNGGKIPSAEASTAASARNHNEREW